VCDSRGNFIVLPLWQGNAVASTVTVCLPRVAHSWHVSWMCVASDKASKTRARIPRPCTQSTRMRVILHLQKRNMCMILLHLCKDHAKQEQVMLGICAQVMLGICACQARTGNVGHMRSRPQAPQCYTGGVISCNSNMLQRERKKPEAGGHR